MLKFIPQVLIISCFIFAASLDGFSQKTVKTENGEEIIIMPDGSWKYKSTDFAEASIINDPLDPDNNPEFSPDTDLSALTKKMNMDYNAMLKDIFEIEQKSILDLSLLKDNIKLLSEEIKLLKNEDSEEEIDIYESSEDLKYELDLLKEEEKLQNSKLKSIINVANTARKTEEAKDLSLDHKYAIVENSFNGFKSMHSNFIGGAINPYTESLEFNADDIDFNPPAQDCKVVFDGIDEVTGKKRKELASNFLFSYTHPKMKASIGDKDFLSCNAFLVSMGGLTYLTLDVTIASKRARTTYGQIKGGSTISLMLINDEKVLMPNLNHSPGQIESHTGNTKYRAIYAMGKKEVKEFKKSEIDKIGIMWSTGYEEYEVYEIDFIMQQLDCLEEK